MNIFLMFLSSMAVVWLGVTLVQPESAFLSFVVYGVAVWLMFETALESARSLFDIFGGNK